MKSSAISVLYAASECVPLVKTGGLGDVAGSLPQALRQRGADVRVLMPAYRSVRSLLEGAPLRASYEPVADLPRATVLETKLPNGVPLLLIDCPELYDRDGGPYQNPAGQDWPDNPLRFGLLSLIAARIGRDGIGGWRPDLLHLNDWQTGLAPAYVRHHGGATPTLMTIHNLAFQGSCDAAWRAQLALPPESWSINGVEYYGQLSFLKAGLFYADALSTVSPTYAQEIQTSPLGMGLEGLLSGRRAQLHGILNGIDADVWNPRTDTSLPARYDARSLNGKKANKRALQTRFALAAVDVPVFGAISRLTPQKGTDLIVACAAEILETGAQLVLAGTGDPVLESTLRDLAADHPGQVGTFIGYDEALAHLIEAGADFFLMPSRFEPCGMNQMYSQRYGTPPVVTATGGLSDSVVDCPAAGPPDDQASGFVMPAHTPAALMDAVGRAIAVYGVPARYAKLQRNGMRRDFSWTQAAGQYIALYRQLVR